MVAVVLVSTPNNVIGVCGIISFNSEIFNEPLHKQQ